jgi:dienelactone hydrolase
MILPRISAIPPLKQSHERNASMPNLTDFELRTLPALWGWYEHAPRQLAFRARTSAEAVAWQFALRERLAALLGGFPDRRADLDPHTIERVEEEGYTRELVVFQSQPGEYVPCYVLLPRSASPPLRPVIALHGHGPGGARPLVGLAPNQAEAESMRAQNNDYARQLARRGFAVFTPVQRGFAERMEEPPLRDKIDTVWQSSCRAVAVNALLLGRTLLGLRVWDVLRLIDYMRSRPEPLAAAIGCVGLSGGGTVALFTTALEPRIACAVVSGYFNTFRDSIMAIDHCLCNYVPGILQYAEMADIAGLVAPRPLLIESGQRDPIFPAAATRRALEELSRVYAAFDAPERLDADFFEGEHRWSGAKAYDWLGRWLSK